jgi:hypothetical protein
VLSALRAVATILRTGSGFDTEQAAHLDAVGVEILSMDRLGLKYQVIERKAQQLLDLFQAPVVPDAATAHDVQIPLGFPPVRCDTNHSNKEINIRRP